MAQVLTEKEKLMELLLNKINQNSSSLVQVGLLPSIPGLFSTDSIRNQNTEKSLPSNLVSANLQSLVKNMELFKSYLIQVEQSKMKLVRMKDQMKLIENISVSINCFLLLINY